MFSRRHPYLFFLLIFSSILAATSVVMSLLIFWGTRHADFEFGEKIGIIEIKGYISEVTPILHSFKRFREDDSIKAIVVRIDSPGGGVGPSQEIYREIKKTIERKKVVASLGTIAASGGYYIAAAANGIVASPGTITGSIGVIMGFTNVQELLKKIGLFPVVVKSGEYKDTGAPHRKMTDKERKLLQGFVDQIHRQFVEAISKGRNIDPAEVEMIADGRIISGESAQELGLVDRLGNFQDAIEWAGKLGGIKGKIATVFAEKKKFSIWRYIADSSLKTILNHAIEPTFYGGYLYVPSGS